MSLGSNGWKCGAVWAGHTERPRPFGDAEPRPWGPGPKAGADLTKMTDFEGAQRLNEADLKCQEGGSLDHMSGLGGRDTRLVGSPTWQFWTAHLSVCWAHNLLKWLA